MTIVVPLNLGFLSGSFVLITMTSLNLPLATEVCVGHCDIT
jgi:hypothetical protein